MSDPFIGQITCFANTYPPSQWMQCRGQLLPISQYAALFSLLGAQFGGNGTSNFALPNLQSNAPIGQGSGPGLTPRDMGEFAGSTSVTLTTQTVPPHNHTFPAAAANGDAMVPASPPNPPSMLSQGNQAGGHGGGTPIPTFADVSGNTPVALNAATLPAYQGGNQPHNNMQPSLALNWCIAVAGIFPTRS